MKRQSKRLLCAVLPFILLLTGCAGAEPLRTEPDSSTGRAELPGPFSAVPAQSDETPTPPSGTEDQTEAESDASAPAQTEAPPEPQPLPSQAELRLAGMSLGERVAQLFVVTPEALSGSPRSVTRVDDALRQGFSSIPVGGVICMGQNLRDPEQTKALLQDLQALSAERLGLPLLLGVDEEGGTVARISGTPAFGISPWPDMAEIGAAGDPTRARSLGRTMGVYLRELGFNLDFAPVADVLTNPDNRVVARRAFGRDAETVIAMAAAVSDGLLDAGVLPCWKHFPGHGSTAADSHLGTAVSQRSFDELPESPELAPFLYAARQGVPMIMTGHISIPGTPGADLPASLSGPLLELLRGPETAYDGLLITDALNMGAIANRFSPGEAAVLALEAGNDLLLTAGHLQEAYEGVLLALQEGRLSEERLNQSVLRILKTKEDLP